MKHLHIGFLTLFTLASLAFGQQPGSIPASDDPMSKENILPKISSRTQAAAVSIPLTMSYQGLLTTGLGTPVSDGSYDLQFNLYDSLSGGSSVWIETQTGVSVQRGTFNVVLGSVTPLNINFNRQLFVNVIATTGPAGPTYPLAFSPRSALASAPYSLAPWSTNGVDLYYNNGAVGIGTNSPSSVIPALRLDIADEEGYKSDIAMRVAGNFGGYPVLNFAKSKGTLASPALVGMGEHPGQILFKAFDGTLFRDAAWIVATIDSTPGFADVPTALRFATTPNGSYLPVERMRITNAGNVGIGTSLPFFPLHVKKFENTGTGVQARVSNTSVGGNSLAAFSLEANNGSVVSQAAVDGLGTGPLATPSGYYGTFTNHPIGFVTNNSERMRITTAGNVGIGTNNPLTTLHLNRTNGTSLYVDDGGAGDGLIDNTTFRGLGFQYDWSAGDGAIMASYPGGVGQLTFWTTNVTMGERMRITYDGKVGIGTTTPSYPLHVRAALSGVAFFENTSASGSATGLWGYATGAGGTTHYGVYGYATGATTNYAGYFLGNVHVTGTLTKGGGAFKIDHPLDPANKYLYHSFPRVPT
jgi:hypothetical protein